MHVRSYVQIGLDFETLLCSTKDYVHCGGGRASEAKEKVGWKWVSYSCWIWAPLRCSTRSALFPSHASSSFTLQDIPAQQNPNVEISHLPEFKLLAILLLSLILSRYWIFYAHPTFRFQPRFPPFPSIGVKLKKLWRCNNRKTKCNYTNFYYLLGLTRGSWNIIRLACWYCKIRFGEGRIISILVEWLPTQARGDGSSTICKHWNHRSPTAKAGG